MNNVSIGKNISINGKLFCVTRDSSSIVLGSGIRINSGIKYNSIGGDNRTILFAEGNGIISIGDRTGLSNCTLFCCESITIGCDVYLGGSVKIYDTDFHWVDCNKRINTKGGKTSPVVIKDGVFVGAHTIVLKGVTINEHAVVGAGSVVTKDIPKGELWAGNPAKYIKSIE